MILPFRCRINTSETKKTRLTRVGQLRALGFAAEAKAVNIEIEEAVLANDWPGGH